jgi:HK97 family phage portal protein
MARGFLTRAIRPPDDITPNPNDPASVPPATVGPNVAVPGDAHGVVVDPDEPVWVPPVITPSAWSGWPDDWFPPLWGGQHLAVLTDTAWMCVDLNASLLSTMPPYLKDAAPSTPADWLNNPDPDIYTDWSEFAKQLFWDYQAAGEVFVLATARYSTGWPARFHVVPGWMVEAEMDSGLRRYFVGREEVTADMLHIRYHSSVYYARGTGPLEAGAARLVNAQLLSRYAAKLAAGGIPAGILNHPEEQNAVQAAGLQAAWVNARASGIGEPAVLSGGLTWQPTTVNVKDMALLELAQWNESRIAALLQVPPYIVGLPAPAGERITYANVQQLFDYHWRAGLRPKAAACMAALSGWLLPRGTCVEVNRDEYVQPDPLQRAQTYQILSGITDPSTGQSAITVAEIREAERLDNTQPDDIASGVLK